MAEEMWKGDTSKSNCVIESLGDITEPILTQNDTELEQRCILNASPGSKFTYSRPSERR